MWGMEVGVVAKRGDPTAQQVADDIIAALPDSVEVLVDQELAGSIGGDGVGVDSMTGSAFVVSVGGDGTLLYVVRHVGETPVLGVNLGEVGFLTTVRPANAVDVVLAVLDSIQNTGRPHIERLLRITAEIGGVSVPSALNEIIVMGKRRGREQGVVCDVLVDGGEYYSGRVDGVIVATPTGSTAYNMSEGGPLVHPSVGCFVVTGMSPRDGMPSLVIDDESTVTIEVQEPDEWTVVSDGRQQSLDAPKPVRIARSEKSARLVGPSSEYFEALEKLR